MIQVVLAGLLVLGPLIAIHEFGHFWMARRCGVRVLTFSIGFGPALWHRTGRDGTEYRLAAIPLGGFVRMLDEREGEVPEALLPQAFNRQSVWRRMAIVAAGPLINLLFAVLLFWLLFLQPGEQLRPVVERVLPDSPAALARVPAGAELVAIDDKPVSDWEQANYALMEHLGDTGIIRLGVMRDDGLVSRHDVRVSRFLSHADEDPFRVIGLVPWTPPLPPVIGSVESGSPAEAAGLQVGDRIELINDHPLTTWGEVVDQIQRSPEHAMTWVLTRQGSRMVLTVTPARDKNMAGQYIGRLGVAVRMTDVKVPPRYIRVSHHGLLPALQAATDKTWQIISLSLGSLGKMLTGLVGMDNLSGPITIVKVAGQSASMGWQAFIGFMALLSVSLGVLNLLPIPVLDGGHLLFYTIEAVWRRPLPESVQLLGLRVGVALMGSVMLLAILNDIRRLF